MLNLTPTGRDLSRTVFAFFVMSILSSMLPERSTVKTTSPRLGGSLNLGVRVVIRALWLGMVGCVSSRARGPSARRHLTMTMKTFSYTVVSRAKVADARQG